jgi:hypothetical protein
MGKRSRLSAVVLALLLASCGEPRRYEFHALPLTGNISVIYRCEIQTGGVQFAHTHPTENRPLEWK